VGADEEKPIPEHIACVEIMEKLTGAIEISRNYILMVILSAIVATGGLIRNNVAILIGAMGIAPLLTLNMALSLAGRESFSSYVGEYHLRELIRGGDVFISENPIYAMVPSRAMVPTVFLATVTTIIASQAVISGAFSLTRQAVQLGYLPRLNIRHTSATQIGQIYVAPVNWMLMVCTIALVIGFRSSSNLAAAYGVAVTSTMLITTMLFFMAARRRWNWPLIWAAPLATVFFLVDVPFFAANVSKILHGAWFPLVIGSVFFMLMLTWEKGRRILSKQLGAIMPPIHQFNHTSSTVPSR